MINRGPNLLIHVHVSALGGAVALSAGITQSSGSSATVGEAGDVYYAVDALGILIVVALAGDRRLRPVIKRFVSEEPLAARGVLSGLAKICLRYRRDAERVG
jgi:hypothetical protein